MTIPALASSVKVPLRRSRFLVLFYGLAALLVFVLCLAVQVEPWAKLSALLLFFCGAIYIAIQLYFLLQVTAIDFDGSDLYLCIGGQYVRYKILGTVIVSAFFIGFSCRPYDKAWYKARRRHIVLLPDSVSAHDHHVLRLLFKHRMPTHPQTAIRKS